MTEFLVKHFVKDPEAITDHSVRTAYGSLTGGVGICLNLLLFLTKLLVGFIAHSVSVMADAFNNLSDAASSIISFVGVRLADKPADEKTKKKRAVSENRPQCQIRRREKEIRPFSGSDRSHFIIYADASGRIGGGCGHRR